MNYSFKELCISVYAEDFVRYAKDREIAARILNGIANLLERNSHEFQGIEDASQMLRKMSLSIKNKTEDIVLVGGPLDGEVLTFKIIERIQTYLVPKVDPVAWINGQTDHGGYPNSSIWSADDRRIKYSYHVYGNRNGSNLYYLEDSYS